MMVRTPTERCLKAKGLGASTATMRGRPPARWVVSKKIQILAVNIVMATAMLGCGQKLKPDPQIPLAKGSETPEVGGRVSSIRSSKAGSGVQVARGAASQVRNRRSLRAVDNPVHGVVTDADGKPVNRARVRLFRRIREWPRDDRQLLDSPVSTGSDGRFEFGMQRDSQLELEVAASGFATQTLLPSPYVDQYVVSMKPGFRVIGRVLDSDDSPSAACEVFLEARSGSRLRSRQTKTDAQGRFAFEGVPADNFRLVARHPDYQPAIFPRVTVGVHRVHTLEFLDKSGLRVSGTVVDENEVGLANGTVRVYPNTPTGLLTVPYESATDSEGRFRVIGLAPGAYVLEVRHPKRSSIARRLSVKRSSVTGLVMVLPRRAKLEGRITGLTNPAGLLLNAVSFFGEIGRVLLREDGSFSFPEPGFSLGLTTLELAADDTVFSSTGSRWHRLHLRDDVKSYVIPTERGLLLAGTAVDSSGQPAAGARVVAEVRRYGDLGLLSARREVVAITDDQGRYTVRGMGRGVVSLGFHTRKFTFGQLRQTPISDVEGKNLNYDLLPKVVLERLGAIAGQVVRGGKPVQGALVMVNTDRYSSHQSHTDEDGRYQILGLPPGDHLVRVKFGALAIEHAPGQITVVPSKTVRGIDIPLPSRRIEGRLLDSFEAPMANVLVETPSGVVGVTDAKGHFQLDVPRKKTWLSIRLREGGPVTQRFLVGDTEDKVQVLVPIAPRAQLRARVLCMPSGLPATGVVVRLEPPARKKPQRQSATTWAKHFPAMLGLALDTVGKGFSRLYRYESQVVERWVDLREGALHLSNLPNRRMLLTIRTKGYLPYVKEVRLANGVPKNLGDIKLRRGSRVHGVVVDSGGNPLAGARLVIGSESELANSSVKTVYVTDKRGCFTVRGVSLMNRRLHVTAKGFATLAYDLSLPMDSLRSPSNPVRLEMQPGATCEIRVEDKARQPMGYVMVRLHRGGELIASQRTGEDGLVSFARLSKDDYRVSIQGWPRSQIGLRVLEAKNRKVYRRRIILKN